MKLGYSPVSVAILDLNQAFRLAAELELDFIELSYDLHEALPAALKASLVKELTGATGIGTTVHLSYIDLNLASVIPAARRTAVERTRQGLDFAGEIGASCGVLHSGRNLIPFREAAMLATQALNESLAELTDPAVPVALENLVLSEADLVRDADQLRDLTTHNGFGNCLDFGHAQVEAVAKGMDVMTTIGNYLESMGNSLIHLHLHNNSGQDDEHRATNDGALDYEAILGRLEGFSGTACLEIMGDESAVRASVKHMRELGVR